MRMVPYLESCTRMGLARSAKSLHDILIHCLAMLNSQDPHFLSVDLIYNSIIPDAKLPVASQRLAKKCAVLVRSASQSRRNGSSNPDVKVLQKWHVLPPLLAGQRKCWS